jgi:hypothetical protein
VFSLKTSGKTQFGKNSFVAKKYGWFSAYFSWFWPNQTNVNMPVLDEKLKIPSQIVLRKTTVTLRGGVFLIK